MMNNLNSDSLPRMCATCGTQYPSATQEECLICLDERAAVPPTGQAWTTLDQVRKNHRNEVIPFENDPRLHSVVSKPPFAIGQRGIVIQTPKGNVMWDCITLIDEETRVNINKLGGLKAIIISHPHFYNSMVEWSKTFGGIPVYIHKADEEWIMNPHECLNVWDGETLDILDGELKIVRCGGHFDGSCVLQWGKKLFTGDTIQVIPDRDFVSFMRAYPNLIPMEPEAIAQIWRSVKPLDFEEIYGGWLGQSIFKNGKEIVLKSAKRYVRAEGYIGHSIETESLP
ncbi:hypothetical protein K7432_004859 [Basidiobolus ranarum]|uniref:Metallo-beta-lactamase domain-containing protein n=1 Tax=Basidiobolus ranarum TaxID=34480 RepID=A0ABR2W3Z4_9FUNG